MTQQHKTTSLVICTCLILAAACGTPSTEIDQKTHNTQLDLDYVHSTPALDAPKFAYWGDYEVGLKTITLTAPDRVELLQIDPETGHPVRTDRHLKTLVWYPAIDEETTSDTTVYTDRFVQDPKWPMPEFPTSWQVRGHAIPDAAPATGIRFPIVLLSHGWAGSEARFAYLGENLASKGYIVLSPDFQDVRAEDPQVFQFLFPRAMVNRGLDIHFIASEISDQARQTGSFFNGLADPDRIALVGHSLGGYGSLRVSGAAYDGTSPGAKWVLGDYLDGQTLQTDEPIDLALPGLKATVLLAPWGAQEGVGLFSDASLAQLTAPLLVIAGDQDVIASYEDGPRRIFTSAGSNEKYLLTFENAGHGIVPMVTPASANSYAYGATATEDAVWRDSSLAAIQQHFVTVFLDWTLKGDDMAWAYLQTDVPRAIDGEWPASLSEAPEAFAPTDAERVTYWPGFRRNRARGLRLERTR